MYGDDRAAEYAEMHGKDVETEDPEDYTPLQCPNCGQKTPQDKAVCMWCNHALDHDSVEQLEETETTIKQLALKEIKEDTSVIDQAEKRMTIVNLLMDDDEFFEDAVDLAEELDVDVDEFIAARQ